VRLSVITPTFNAGQTLECTITSVLKQRLSGVEHLIVDGCSTDTTLETVERYEHLRLISESDESIYDAMNKGIRAAKGEWLYFLGADDVFVDQCVLSDLKEYFESDFDVIYGDVISTRFNGKYDGPFDVLKILKRNICHQAIFFRREVFDRVGTFNPIYRSHADWDHNMRWLLDPKVSSKYVDRVIANYADHGFSSLNPDPAFRRDRLYRYLSYAGTALPRSMYLALWSKEMLQGISHADLARLRRASRLVRRK